MGRHRTLRWNSTFVGLAQAWLLPRADLGLVEVMVWSRRYATRWCAGPSASGKPVGRVSSIPGDSVTGAGEGLGRVGGGWRSDPRATPCGRGSPLRWCSRTLPRTMAAMDMSKPMGRGLDGGGDSDGVRADHGLAARWYGHARRAGAHCHPDQVPLLGAQVAVEASGAEVIGVERRDSAGGRRVGCRRVEAETGRA